MSSPSSSMFSSSEEEELLEKKEEEEEKEVSIYLDNWFVDQEVIRTNGYQESPLFGTESTKFYWQAREDGCATTFRLYLAACKVAKLFVKVWCRLGDWSTGEEETAEEEKANPGLRKGVLSLDKSKTLQVTIFMKTSFFITPNIIFQEPYGTMVGFLQLKHLKALTSQLVTFRENVKSDTLITLVTTLDGREFTANKEVLAARSTVFAAMFDHKGFKESQLKRVEIEDVTGEVMDALLKYVYSADVEGIKAIVGELLKAADKYDLPLLVEECAQLMIKHLVVSKAAYTQNFSLQL